MEPFKRSGKTSRSPPKVSELSESNILDPSQQNCKLCEAFDNEDMVRCDDCKEWYHFECVGVTREIENEDWSCEECLKQKSGRAPSVKSNADQKSTKSSNTQRSHASSAAKRKQLALDRIEEERKLREAREKEYLDKKYQTLEHQISSDSEGEQKQMDHENLSESSRRYTSQWVDKQTDLIDMTGDDDTNEIENARYGCDMPNSTEYNGGSSFHQPSYSNTFWQNYHDNLFPRYAVRTTQSQPDLASQETQISVQQVLSDNIVGIGQSSNEITSNDQVEVSVAATEDHTSRSTSTSVSNVISSNSVTRNVNSASISKSSNLQTIDKRRTTYSVFANQDPIMNSSVVTSKTVPGFLDFTHQFSNFGGQRRVTTTTVGSQSFSGQMSQPIVMSSKFGSQSIISTAVTSQYQAVNPSNYQWKNATFVQEARKGSSNPVYQPFNVGPQNITKPSNVGRPPAQNSSNSGGQPFQKSLSSGGQQFQNSANSGGQQFQQPSNSGGQPNQNSSSFGGQQFQNSSSAGGQQVQNLLNSGGPQFQQPSNSGGQPNQNSSSFGGQQFQNSSSAGGQQVQNLLNSGGPQFQQPSNSGGQPNQNSSSFGGQQFQNSSSAGGQQVQNLLNSGGPQFQQPSNSGGQPNQNSSSFGGQQFQNSSSAGGQQVQNLLNSGGPQFQQPSNSGGQPNQNSSSFGGQQFQNSSSAGGQQVQNLLNSGGPQFQQPSNSGGQPNQNSSSFGGQQFQNSSSAGGQQVQNLLNSGGPQFQQPSNPGGQPNQNSSSFGGQQFQNSLIAASQQFQNSSNVAGQHFQNPSNSGRQTNQNSSSFGGQQFQNSSSAGGQQFQNLLNSGGQQFQNHLNSGGQPNQHSSGFGSQQFQSSSNAGGQQFQNLSNPGGQTFHSPSSLNGQQFQHTSNTGGQPFQNLLNSGGQTFMNSSTFGAQPNLSGTLNTTNVQRNDGNFTLDGRTNSRLDPNQIAARHAMPRNLPTFKGTPEEWPLFISAYENSTKACGYSNSENLGRLLDCLKGDALEAVRCILLHPNSVPEAMQTLEMMFGRPELVIETLFEELQKESSPKENDLNALVKFAMKVRNLVATVRKFGPLDHLQNPLLVKILVEKLPTQTRINWAYFKHSNPKVNLASFGDWLYSLAQVTSQVVGRQKSDSSKKDRKDNHKEQKPQQPKPNYVNAQSGSSSVNHSSEANQQIQYSKQCPICFLDACKTISDCSKFRGLTSKERWETIKGKKLCYSCFGKHRQFRCRSRKKCQIDGCQSNHHVLLHDSERQVSTSSSQAKSKSSSGTKSNAQDKNVTTARNCNSLQAKLGPAIFKIIPVKLYYKKKVIHTFAYLDSGSDLTMMERELARELDISGTPEILNVRWAFKDSEEQTDSEAVTVRISGAFKYALIYKIDGVSTVDKLFLPSQSITKELLDSYPHLRELPIATYENGVPRILIGLHNSKLMVSQETVEGEWNEPIACRTRLGWVVQGPDEKNNTKMVSDVRVSLNICECHADNQLHQLVKEFFSFESFGTRVSEKILESKETARAREILESTTVKKNGRFETGLLWRYNDVHLPDSYGMALKRLNCLESKMKRDPALAKKLIDQIDDFVGMKYIRKLLPKEIEQKSSRTWYLPIFVVFNPKKPLKVRTVWDAAAKVKNVSLNSVLLKGPDQLVPLPDVLRRFRERLYAITGDIGEMYHRVGVIKEDRCAQRFLWRDGQSNRKPDVYEMEVLTFGSACSPSSAQYVKNKNALEFKNHFPRAVEAIVDNTYIDDMLDCTHTEAEAVRLMKDVRFIHKQAAFEIGKFTSNSEEILRALGEDVNPQIKNLNLSSETTTERVLGMFWNTSNDMFTYSLKYAKTDEMVLTGNRNPTKREVLRALMSIFDPLGLIANVLVYAKILLQRIWRKSTDWDEQITGSLQDDWIIWIRLLPQVENLEIPRLYSPKMSPGCPKSIQVHTFVDASIEACAAVTYFRIEDEFGVDCVLVGAKTKVAPNKPLTVPRLELQAAVLGSRLTKNIEQSQRFKITKRYFWSDSQTVLSWITSETRKYNQFVAFRVGEILDNSVENEWNWVSTDENVADEATKSKNKPNITSSSRWFKGPSFLYQSEDSWNQVVERKQHTTDEELRPRYLLAQFISKCENVINPQKFSRWRKLRRTLALVLRFIDNIKLKKGNRTPGPLLRSEYIRAENRLYKQAQTESFPDEIAILHHNSESPVDKRKEFDKNSALKTCSPYFDEFGVLRVKGRNV